MSIDINRNNSSKKSHYRPEIDGLRAFAVVAVIINHFNKNFLPNGYLGVDIFFVISGFVITSSLYQRPNENFKDFISGFYGRRIKRILPGLLTFVLITSITICLFNPNPILSLNTGLTSLFGISNLYLLKHSTDYFAQSTALNVFAHTWSLGVEEQFYIIFPFLIWFSGFSRHIKNSSRNLFLIVGGITITSLISFLLIYPINQPAAYFLMPSRFWEMAAGCLIFLESQKRKSIKHLFCKLPPLFLLVLIIGVMYLPTSLERISTVGVVSLSSMLIASLEKEKKIVFKIFTNRKVVYIGLISYSLYLWHWGVLSISRWTIGIHWWSLPFQIALTLVFAVASYRYIERPLRNSKWFSTQWKTLAFGGSMILTLSSFLIVLNKVSVEILYLGNASSAIRDDYSEHFPATRRKCFKQNYSISNCFIPSRHGSSQTMLLIGDSHAGHLIPLLGEFYANSDININIFITDDYPKILESNNEGLTLKASRERIDNTNKRFYDFVKKMKSGDFVVLSSRWEHQLYNNFYDIEHSSRKRKLFSEEGKQITHAQAIKIFEYKLNNIAEKLGEKGIKILIFAPIPVFRGIEDPLPSWACSKEWFRPFVEKSCNLKFQEKRASIDKRNQSIRNTFVQIKNKYKNAHIYDPFNLLCPSKKLCTTIVDQTVIFRDNDHLSRDGSKYLYSDFTKFLYINNLLQSD